MSEGQALEPGEPDEPLHDDALNKALAQAPDRTSQPDWRIRQAILDQAHDSISASEELLAASRERAPWWRLAWWRDKVGLSGATPWNAALASVMVAVLVTVMWQREPVPGARLDEMPAPPASSVPDEESEAAKKETAPSVAGRVTPAPTPEPTPAPKAAPAPAPAPTQAPTPAPRASERTKAPSAPAPASETPASAKAPSQPQPPAMAESASRPPAVSSAAAPPPPAPAFAPAPPVADTSAERRRSALAESPAPVPRTAQEANRDTGALSRQAPAAAAAPPAPAVPVAPIARGETARMPDFASLSRWTELRVVNINGDVRVVPRAQAGELALLMSSAAIMAVGAPPMRSLPEWRVLLERRGQVVALLEVGRSDVRWTEGALPSTTGAPPAESIEALRAALRQAIKSGSAARAIPAVPPVQAPQAPDLGASQRLPYAPLAPPVLPESRDLVAPSVQAPQAPPAQPMPSPPLMPPAAQQAPAAPASDDQ